MSHLSNVLGLLGLVLIGALHCNAIQLMRYKLIDYKEKADPTTYLLEFCSETPSPLQEKLVVRESTVKWLNEGLFGNRNHFDTKLPEPQLNKCREGIHELLPELNRVVNNNNRNVCGVGKIKAIENFHRDFIANSGNLSMLKKLDRTNARVKLLESFFMLYASKISSNCENQANEKLNIIKKNAASTSDIDYETDIAVSQLSEIMKIVDLKGGYNDIFLLWKFTSAQSIEKNKKFSKYVSPQAVTKLNIQMRNVDTFWNLKSFCKTLLRPVYDNTFMPVLRLVQLGYYPESELLIRNFQTDKHLKRLFVASLLCDLLAPVTAYQNETLEATQIIVLERQEAEELALVVPNSSEAFNLGRKSPSFLLSEQCAVGSLLCKDSTSCRRKLKSIRHDIKARDKTYDELMKRIMSEVKSNIGRKSSNFFLSSKTSDGKRVQQDILRVTEDTLKDADAEGVVAPDSSELVRKKRGLLRGMIGLIHSISHLMISIIWLILKTVARLFIRSVKIMSNIVYWTQRFLVKVFI